ncbi:MAG: TIGR02452 family protein [Bacteroidota bacterium]
MTKSHRTTIAQQTIQILESGSYKTSTGAIIDISSQLADAVRGTRLYRPEDFPDEIPVSKTGTTAMVEVTGETSLEAIARLVREGATAPLCLNFASAKNPGGGFLSGSQAQEESLARSSGLYATLIKTMEMYQHNRAVGTCLYSDYMIYSPAVPVFRNDDGDLLAAPHTVAFLTAPAVNAGAVERNEPRNVPAIRETTQRRLHRLLWVAKQQGHSTLILGAWGCGVFANDPLMIAELFREALGTGGTFSGDFSRIVYAVYDRSAGREMLKTFAAVLSTR